jgi:hypothetical protein
MLTEAQLPTLKAAILAETDPVFVEFRTQGATGAMANFFNLEAVPAYWVWKTKVPKTDYTNGVSVDGTTFSWTGSGFITRQQGERDAWRELFSTGNAVNPSLANVRQAFTDIFSGGTAPAPANRTHLLAMSRRPATRGEKLFATGAGTTANPSLLVFEGSISGDDVVQALAI